MLICYTSGILASTSFSYVAVAVAVAAVLVVEVVVEVVVEAVVEAVLVVDVFASSLCLSLRPMWREMAFGACPFRCHFPGPCGFPWSWPSAWSWALQRTS